MGSDPLFARAIVLDTNIVLDLFLFADTAYLPLKQALDANTLCWLATAAMRDELERVLAYPQILQQLSLRSLTATNVLAAFDRHSRSVDAAIKAPVTCKDRDDQKFVDLAVAHGATLLSKDRAVLALKKRLIALAVHAGTCFPVD